MSETVALERPRPIVLADLVPGALVRDVLLVVGAAGFVGLLAQISIHLSFTPVPVTGQTLGVLLAGTALGWRRGAAALALYAIAGVAGVPWFAGHGSGYAGASFGYIIGFVFAAALCGYLAERRADRFLIRSVPAMIAAELVIYVFGLAWLASDLHLGIAATLRLGLVPFIAGDAIKAAIAAGLLPAAWRLAGSGPRGRGTGTP
jgi:biotin transport system substrate-specific component